jgi:16S rRNA (adenine1518-N6/adenine1519-N6)-dimethyltransferase
MKISDLKALLASHGITPSKDLGQNFLVQDEVAMRIASLVAAPFILEIGPGCGAITLHLAKLNPEKLILMEKDNRLAPILRALVPQGTLMIQDALLADWQPYNGFSLVGNLPYHVSVPLFLKYVKMHSVFEQAIFIFQKEVAQRIVAMSGKSYGRLSVMAQAYTHPSWIMAFPPECAWPIPQVDSAVLSFTAKNSPVDYDILERIVTVAFCQRRKMIHHGLRALDFQKSDLIACHIDPTCRAENLSVQDFVNLSLYYKRGCHKR